MKILFIGGIFDDCHNVEIISKTRTYVEYAANNFQRKIIEGIKECGMSLDVISAPFVGAYPNAYSDIYFRGFAPDVNDQSDYQYVHFNNIWGIRNPSRKRAIVRALKSFIEAQDSEKLILVYTPHTPFIQAANYAKRKDSRIKICLVVPDLPQYMNLASHVSPIYRFFKKYDVETFMKANRQVDSYVILTRQMADVLEIDERPYAVIEGIYEKAKKEPMLGQKSAITIVYTGKLDHNFGVMNLVHAFMEIQDDRLKLLICGSGEEKQHVEEAAQKDDRIDFKGQVSSDEAKRYILDGDILVNPRQNDSDYTKYSFPSKVIDYLATGNAVVTYKLDGMPDVYDNFIYFVPDNTVASLRDTLLQVLNDSKENRKAKSQAALNYLEHEISKRSVGEKILSLNITKE